MTPIVEKNDVNISPLFAWNKAFVVDGLGDELLVYMRIVGDADINKARVSALRRSADLRKKLKDSDSDERIAYIRDIEELPPEVLVDTIIILSMRDLTEETKKELKVKPPKAPRSDAKTELHEKYQAEIDAFPDKYRDELRKALEKKLDSKKKELLGLSKEALYKQYERLMIDELCERELMSAFKEWTTYLASYADESLKTHLFESFEEFSNLPPEIKNEFLREYSLMEMSMDELKKLRPVTP